MLLVHLWLDESPIPNFQKKRSIGDWSYVSEKIDILGLIPVVIPSKLGKNELTNPHFFP